MERKIVIKKYNDHHPLLKRYVHHDSKSRAFAYNTEGLTLKNTVHHRNIPILNQGNVGSCTGNAGIGALSTDQYYSYAKNIKKYSLDESGAVKLYSDAEVIDGNGSYPPNDNGSCGLSIAKALTNAGYITEYQHTFSLNDALLALTQHPILVGVDWYDTMFNPDADGRVHPTGKIAGGHEIVARELDDTNKRVWFDNSWGSSWGKMGRFYLTYEDFDKLLHQQGDVIVLIPKSNPAPSPAPLKDQADIELATAMKKWFIAKGL